MCICIKIEYWPEYSFKLTCNISQLYVMLMNDRMKAKYVLGFCNSFLKIDSNCVN